MDFEVNYRSLSKMKTAMFDVFVVKLVVVLLNVGAVIRLAPSNYH